jgi:putative ABC transport system permease protein
MGSRRAMALWSWRLIRREWRQQALVLSLVLIAIALSSFFAVIFANSNASGSGATHGTATHELRVFAGQAPLAEQQRDIAAQFDPIAVTAWRAGIRLKGAPTDFDLSDSVSPTVFGGRPFTLTKGAWPTASGEIALSDALIRDLGASIGETIDLTDHTYQVVGRFEDPDDLRRLHAIVAPGTVSNPTGLQILTRSDDATVKRFEDTAREDRFVTSTDFSNKSTSRFINTMLVYLMTSVGMVEIGLLCAAGFAVMARRRIREFGVLGAIGAKERELRRAMAMNGLLIGIIGGALGVATGFGASLLFQPSVEQLIGARIGFWGIPWSSIVPFVALAAITSTLAAWWPARSIARASIVESIAARRPAARPVRRTAIVALATVVIGAVVHSRSVASEIYVVAAVSIAAALIGMLLLAPAAISRIGQLSARLPLPFRIAGRDLARHQGRSAAALAALILALGIPVGLAIAGTSADASTHRPAVNLPADIALVNVRHGTSTRDQSNTPPSDFDPASVAAELSALTAAIPGARLVPVMAAADPTAPDRELTYADGVTVKERAILRVNRPNGPIRADGNRDFSFVFVPAWIATPDVLRAFHLDEGLADSSADLLGPPDNTVFTGEPFSPRAPTPLTIEPLGLDRFGSISNYWVPPAWVDKHGFETTINAWMIVIPSPISAAQRNSLRIAAGSRLTVETRVEQSSSTSIRRNVLVVGGLVGLAILAVVVSLIRSEAAEEQFTLAAVGARRRARRSISAATAALLAGTAAILAVPTGYLSLVGLMSNPTAKQGFVVPLDALSAVLIGFPLVATVGAWLATRNAPDHSTRRIL